MTTTEPPAHLIKKAARRMSKCLTFEPDLCGACASRLDDARAALLAVADDLRAEGAREALTDYADLLDERASMIVRMPVHSSKAIDVLAYRDEAYPATEGER